jgi:hypothetical protein
MELGYQSTEFRGTLALDAESPAGLVPLTHTYVEFVEETAWNDGTIESRPLDELEPGRRYQVVVTTAAGLYRYAMNDLVEVCGRHRATPLLRFVQKGRGVTSLTGEKLYESQVIDAVQEAAAAAAIASSFFLMIADENASTYTLVLEADGAPAGVDGLAARIDGGLATRNLEYQAKRESGRLPPLRVVQARPGSGEAYKAASVRAGQREGQYKPPVLVYARDLKMPIETLIG